MCRIGQSSLSLPAGTGKTCTSIAYRTNSLKGGRAPFYDMSKPPHKIWVSGIVCNKSWFAGEVRNVFKLVTIFTDGRCWYETSRSCIGPFRRTHFTHWGASERG